MQLSALQTAFPNKSKSIALTGLIPIDYYNSHKAELRNFIKSHNFQLYFRGKRNGRSMKTLKRDAHSIVIYPQAIKVTNDTERLLEYAKKVDTALNLFVAMLLIAAAIFTGYITVNSTKSLAFTSCMSQQDNPFFTALNECASILTTNN